MTATFIASLSSGRRHAGQAIGALAAFGAGLLLALMIAQNGALARATDPWLASWLAHGVGTLVAALLWGIAARVNTHRRKAAQAGAARAMAVGASLATTPAGPASCLLEAMPSQLNRVPYWAWLGGLPGALTVVLAAFCLNSPLGMAGTLALLLLGQLLFGALCDGLGWFGLPRRRPQGLDLLAAFLVMAGALLILLR
ncbi:hypothetical protein D3C79_797220 [compost metagenome]